jgi:hypothetical protein
LVESVGTFVTLLLEIIKAKLVWSAYQTCYQKQYFYWIGWASLF